MTSSTPNPQAVTKRSERRRPDKRVSLRLPPQFKALCEQGGMTMPQLLRSFAADLCGIKPLTKMTKYVSHGEAAQAAARAYYEAARLARRAQGDEK